MQIIVLTIEFNGKCKLVLKYVPGKKGVKLTNPDGEKEVYLSKEVPVWMDPYHQNHMKNRHKIRKKVVDLLAAAKGKNSYYKFSVPEDESIGIFRFKTAAILLLDTKGKIHTLHVEEMEDTTKTEYNPHTQNDETKIVPRVMMRTMASDGKPVRWVIPYSGVPKEPEAYPSPKTLAKVLADKHADAKAKEHASAMDKELAYVFDVYRRSTRIKAKDTDAPEEFLRALDFRVERVLDIIT